MNITSEIRVKSMDSAVLAKGVLSEALDLIGLDDIDLNALPPINASRRKLRAGQALYAQDSPFDAVFVVRVGTFKTSTVDDEGLEQVLGFSLRGDILGSDAAATGVYSSYAVALEDSEVIAIPMDEFRKAGDACRIFERHLFRCLSQDLGREHQLLAMIGTLGADARVARFLAALSDRYARMGYSPKAFVLRMTRQEIANHLGLTMETVSRAFSNLARAGLIEANQRSIKVIDLQALRLGRDIGQQVRQRAAAARNAKSFAVAPATMRTVSQTSAAATAA